jgi:lipid-binding SYLF domain-containing protein
MKKLILVLAVLALSAVAPAADEAKDESKAADRIKAAGTVLDEIQAAPDQGIPEEVLGSAECVAVVPSMLKAGFIVGARYGRGVASCRTEKGWSAPAFFMVGGGSFGLQIGGQAVDLVMLIMNKDGMKNLLSSKFKLGADASAAAGPVGRHASADTDWKLKAQVLTYSRSRGFYGRMVPFRTSLTGNIEAPPGSGPFLSTLAHWAQSAAKK